MEQLVTNILASAAKSLWENEPTLSAYTSVTGEHELNLSFHYATELRKWFPWLDCDVELTKQASKNKRPDIVFHKRGRHTLNFLVVEVKRQRYANGAMEDLGKIRENWFKRPLRYELGACVILDEETRGFSIMLISQRQTEPTRCTDSDFAFILPPVDKNKISKMCIHTNDPESISSNQSLSTEMAKLYCQE